MHAAEAVSSPLSIISLGDVGGDDGVTDRVLLYGPGSEAANCTLQVLQDTCQPVHVVLSVEGFLLRNHIRFLTSKGPH